MPSYDDERLAVANALLTSLARKDSLTPVQARSFVRSLQVSWQVPPIRWGAGESSEQLADARRLIHAAEIFYQVEGSTSSNANLCYRRAGELLEWLTRASDPISSMAPIELFAAGAYQLGGLPSMAAGLLTLIDLQDRGSRLYARFLHADFDGVLDLVMDFWQRHDELTERNASENLLSDNDPERISWHITVELIRSLGLVSDSLRRGDNSRLERALTKLDALDMLAVRTCSNDASLLITILCSTAKRFKEASIYKPVFLLSQFNLDQRQLLQMFAREQFSCGRGILWSSQRRGLDRLARESSFALCTPTGSGKTLVATLALIKELMLVGIDKPAPMALYLVPSRALAGEIEHKLTNELGKDFIITGLYGGADWGLTDYWLTADRPTVLIATVEKADALMRYLGPVLISRLRLLIVDEAHQVVPEDNEDTRIAFAAHRSRAIRVEGLISRIMAQSPGIARIALTAVAGGAATPVACWMEKRDRAEAVGSRERSMRQIVGKFETKPGTPGRMLLDLMNGQPLYVRGRDEPVYIGLRIPVMPQLPASMRNSVYRFNELSVLWTALHLVDDERRILISVAQNPEKTMGWYKEALELANWKGVPGFRLPNDDDQLEKFQEAKAACVDYCGMDSYEVALLDRGIATSHGQMPQRLRRLMTHLIDQRICPITVATSTLTEGVNLPFDIIFLTSLKRRSFDPTTGSATSRAISTAEFNNLAGRAGRPGAGKGMEGITLVAVPQRHSTTAPSQVWTQRRQIEGLKNDYNTLRRNLLAAEIEGEGVSSPLALLLNSIADRSFDVFGISEEEFVEWLESAIPMDISEDVGTGSNSEDARLADSIDELDNLLLTALEEIGRIENQNLEAAEIETFLSRLWQSTFTHVAAVQEAWLEQAFIRRGRSIIQEIYSDADERKRLYQYGFPPCVGRRFQPIAQAIRAEIANTATYGTAPSQDRLGVFESLGRLLEDHRGYGFRIRDTLTDQKLLENWRDVLGWWMQVEGAVSPNPGELRSWQRFVADNLEFRLGVAIGAAVTQAWSDGADGPMAVPALDTWRETTGLPWFGFWVRELLRWGTLDPFVAFALVQGLSATRDEASELRSEFEAWLFERNEDLEADDMVSPELFMEWHRSLQPRDREKIVGEPIDAELTGTNGQLGRYNVIPIMNGMNVRWLDASGYELARSQVQAGQIGRQGFRDDFELRIDGDIAAVERAFTAH